ncbi:pirin family protein [Novosphingobium sp. YJ-S2-02]|uniref:Pirin family protein n=1 Tax=Novosphingobium aureum TaxID=2792964 RepID=A0A931MJF3_9SPHN|nr:pirin family protein [Novosphingobium aureum]MBH0111757.1 pirin family protein [Novosphingobium aureum]
MIELRPFESLGAANHGWLDAHHHFSFASYHDPERTNWGRLRVWNDDTIAAGTGFPPHPHRDMEIVTYVRQGAISHQDNLGNKGRTVAGDVQVMSAGSGIQHSEYNLEKEDTTIFQIWIMPEQRGGEPSWGTRPFPKDDRAGRFVTLASGANDDGDALPIRADARVLGATVRAGETVTYETLAGRHAYLVSTRGRIRVADGASEAVEAAARDGVAITGLDTISVTALEDAELVLVDAA